MSHKIQVRRGLQSDLPLLDEGEIGFSLDEKRTYIGSPTGNVELAKASELADKVSQAEVTSQLAETPQRLKSNLTVTSEKKRAVVTFIDDDTRREVLTRLKPIFDAKGVPCSVAAITGRFDNPDHLNASEIKGLQDSGWEVLGHTYTHPTSTGYGILEYAGDYEKLEFEIATGCKDILLANGIKADGFVYPQGGHDFDVREITKKHYDYAFAATKINGDELMD